ncbi:MAG: hypothetical protein R8J84_00695, partial [Mariprofundales bacterium]
DSGASTGLVNKKKNARHAVGVLWGWAKIGGGFGAVARFEIENVELLTGMTAANVKQKAVRTVIGLDYTPMKNLNFTLGYDTSKLTNKNYSPSSVTNMDQTNKTYGLWSQFKF